MSQQGGEKGKDKEKKKAEEEAKRRAEEEEKRRGAEGATADASSSSSSATTKKKVPLSNRGVEAVTETAAAATAFSGETGDPFEGALAYHAHVALLCDLEEIVKGDVEECGEELDASSSRLLALRVKSTLAGRARRWFEAAPKDAFARHRTPFSLKAFLEEFGREFADAGSQTSWAAALASGERRPKRGGVEELAADMRKVNSLLPHPFGPLHLATALTRSLPAISPPLDLRDMGRATDWPSAEAAWKELAYQAKRALPAPKAAVHAVAAVDATTGVATFVGAEEDRFSKACYLCGTTGHGMRKCPTTTCQFCQKLGHIAVVCPNASKQVKSCARAAALSSDRGGGRVWVDVGLGGREDSALFDPGAECSIVDRSKLQGIVWEAVPSRWGSLSAAKTGAVVEIETGARVRLRVGSREVDVVLAVVASGSVDEPLLLGADVLERLGLMDAIKAALRDMGAEPREGRAAAARTRAVGGAETRAETAAVAAAAAGAATVAAVGSAAGPRLARLGAELEDEGRWETAEAIAALDLSHLDDLPELRDRLRRELTRLRRAFLREGRLPAKARVPPVRIRVVGEPVIVHSRPWSLDTEKRLSGHEEELVREGLAWWVSSAAWRGEPLLVWKTNGTTRYTGDFRKTNKSLAGEAFPMPNIRTEGARMAGGTVFSKWDMPSGFWQVGVTDDSVEVSTLRGTKGLLQSDRLQMGHKPAPGHFNQAVRTHLVDPIDPRVRERLGHYLDDLGHSSLGERRAAVEAEVRAIVTVLERAVLCGFVFSLKKCLFCVPSLVWCGLEFNREGSRPSPSRVRALVEMADPITKTDLRSFTGLAGAWRAYIERFAELMQPLYAAQSGTGKLVVTDGLRARLAEVRRACAEARVMREPDFSKPFTMRVDGSGVGFGAVLEQDGRPVAVDSRAKQKGELNFAPFDTEWGAVIFGLDAFEYWISGSAHELLILSDHKNLQFALEDRVMEDKTHRRARWLERLQRVPHRVLYAPREMQKVPDALSKDPAHKAVVAQLKEEQRREQAAARVMAATARPARSRAGKRRRRRERRASATRAAAASSAAAPTVGAAVSAARATRRESTDNADKAARAAGARRDEGESAAGSVVVTAAVHEDAAVWRERQSRDAVLAAAIAAREGGGLEALAARNVDELVLREGVLYHLHRPHPRAKRSEFRFQIVVPDVDGLRKQWFKSVHEEEAGHMKAAQTLARLQYSVWWPRMQENVVSWCKNCAVCLAHTPIEGNWGPLRPTTTESLRGRRVVASDILGPLPVTPEGYKYIYVGVDVADGWVYLVALKEATAAATTRALLEEVVPSGGVMDELLSDRAGHFTAAHAQGVYDAVGVDKATTATYSPWADGAEHEVKIVKACAKRLVDQRGERWVDVLWLLKVVLRSRVNEGMGISAFERRMGRKMVLPHSFLLPDNEVHDREWLDLKKLHKELEAVRDAKAAKMKAKFDAQLVEKNFVVGDLVWVRNEKKTDTLDVERVGPFKIKKIVAPLNVQLEEVAGGPGMGRRQNMFSIRNLDNYTAEEIVRHREHRIEDVVEHAGKGRGRKYRVVWADGAESWEPRKNLVDKAEDGTETVAEPLLRYWERNPALSRSW
jgi:hypothetical protein